MLPATEPALNRLGIEFRVRPAWILPLPAAEELIAAPLADRADPSQPREHLAKSQDGGLQMPGFSAYYSDHPAVVPALPEWGLSGRGDSGLGGFPVNLYSPA